MECLAARKVSDALGGVLRARDHLQIANTSSAAALFAGWQITRFA